MGLLTIKKEKWKIYFVGKHEDCTFARFPKIGYTECGNPYYIDKDDVKCNMKNCPIKA